MRVSPEFSNLNRRRLDRSAFSLVELLIVIALIGILAALAASAATRLIGVREAKTTEDNLLKLQSLLEQHWRAVIAKANSDTTIPDFTQEMAGKLLGTPNWEKRARVLHVKFSLRQQFPVTIGEVSSAMPGYPVPLAYLPAVTAGLTMDQMSSALLYLALKQARSGVDMNADTVFNVIDTIPSAKPDVRVILDGWQKPIVFSRWPWGHPDLNPPDGDLQSITTTGPIDSQDPLGLLSDQWTNTPKGNQFSTYAYKVAFQRSYKLLPVLMSGGPDKYLGLDVTQGAKSIATLKIADPNQAVDNIYSNRLRMGGSGN